MGGDSGAPRDCFVGARRAPMSERCRSTIDRVFDHGKVAFGACGGASRWLLVDDGRSLLSIW